MPAPKIPSDSGSSHAITIRAKDRPPAAIYVNGSLDPEHIRIPALGPTDITHGGRGQDATIGHRNGAVDRQANIGKRT